MSAWIPPFRFAHMKYILVDKQMDRCNVKVINACTCELNAAPSPTPPAKGKSTPSPRVSHNLLTLSELRHSFTCAPRGAN